jgi:L,D-transpeptidase ErfK/SrfK
MTNLHETRIVSLICATLIAASAPAGAQDQATVVMAGGSDTYIVRPGDTAGAIAARFGVSVAALVDANRLKRPDAIVPGEVLVVEHPHLAIVDPSGAITINVPQRMLVLAEDGRPSAYAITVGQRTWPTPLGPFTIVDKERNPTWDVPVSIQREMQRQGKPVITRMEPSPDNPLGAHWLRLSIPGLGIHGTNAPSSIYRYASHGCIRMHPEDVAQLFERVAVGTRGVLIYQPVVMALIEGRVWLEAHPDPYRLAGDTAAYVKATAEGEGIANRINWARVSAVLRVRAGRPEDVTIARERGSTDAER